MKETRENDCHNYAAIQSSQSNNRATTVTSESNAVDILLDKMDRFSECEKLLDKNLFKQEYAKELSKNKKSNKGRRNIWVTVKCFRLSKIEVVVYFLYTIKSLLFWSFVL